MVFIRGYLSDRNCDQLVGEEAYRPIQVLKTAGGVVVAGGAVCPSEDEQCIAVTIDPHFDDIQVVFASLTLDPELLPGA